MNAAPWVTDHEAVRAHSATSTAPAAPAHGVTTSWSDDGTTPIATNASRSREATQMPGIAPMAHATRLRSPTSVKTMETSCHGVAPSARKAANSRLRPPSTRLIVEAMTKKETSTAIPPNEPASRRSSDRPAATSRCSASATRWSVPTTNPSGSTFSTAVFI